MPILNRVQIIGRLGKDPEKRTTKNGKEVTVFPVAVNRIGRKHVPEIKPETDWFQVEAWGKLGEICAKYLSKGRLVFLEGRLRTDRYEHEGETRYFTRVIAHQMQMLDKPPRESLEPEPEVMLAEETDEEDEL